jgi:RNA polymerase sigma-70 factor (ECF subfamily)
MPPMPYEYHGRDATLVFLRAIAPPQARVMRMAPVRANGCPASGFYALDPATGVYRALGLYVFGLAGRRISEIVRFEVGVMASFGLPRTLGPHPGEVSHPPVSGRGDEPHA